MKPVIKRLSKSLAGTVDGRVACDAINALTNLASKGDGDSKAILAEYMVNGQVEHMRDFACSSLAEIVNDSDSELARRFDAGLSDDSIRYWSILGYANTLGSESYTLVGSSEPRYQSSALQTEINTDSECLVFTHQPEWAHTKRWSTRSSTCCSITEMTAR